MSRHHYDDFWEGNRRRDPMVPVAYLLQGHRLPRFWAGRPRHRVIDGFKPKMSTTIRANQGRREKTAQKAAEAAVIASRLFVPGRPFEFRADLW